MAKNYITDDIDARLESAGDLASLSLEDRNKQAASHGVSNAGKVKLQLNRLRQNGVLIDLYIGGTSMFSTAALWSELGVMDVNTKRLFTKGRKSLVPSVSSKLKSNETRLRQVLDKHSFDVAGFRPWRLVMWTAYEEWKNDHERLIAQREEIKQDALENYEQHRQMAILEYTQVAHTAWASITGQEYNSAIINGKSYAYEEDFVDAVIEAMLLKFPTQERIEQDIVAYHTTSLIYGEADVVSDQISAQALRERAALITAEAEAERRKIQSAVYNAEQEQQHKEQLRRLERREKELKLEAMRQAEIENAREYLDKVGNPYVEIIKQMRTRFAKDAESILESIQKNGYVRGKVAQKGRGLIGLYELIAAHDDSELREKLEKLKTEIGIVGDDEVHYRNIYRINDTLNEIADLAIASSEELTEVSREAFVEI